MFSGGGGRSRQTDFDDPRDSVHYPTRPVDKDKAEAELTINIQKATSLEETAPKQKHVRKCIVHTWDYSSSLSIWTGLRVQPILSDEVQTFKALIVVHKVLQEGHPITIQEGQGQTGWLETCARTVGSDGQKGYGALIRAYVSFILSKLRLHRSHPKFNGLFEYEEYVSLKGTDDPNQDYETITDLMNLQDQIESFQKLIFAHFRHSANNECRISALVPLVKESWGIYRFITSMLRAMYRRTDDRDALEPLRQRYNSQHYSLRKFYYECSNLKYLTGLINVPKLGQDPPNLLDSGSAGPDLPNRPTTTKPPATPDPRMQEFEREMLVMRAQYERDQMMLEQYDRRVKALEGELATTTANAGSQLLSKDELNKQLTEQVNVWRGKFEALAKLYTQLRSEHLDMLGKFKQLQLKANSAQEATDKIERMEVSSMLSKSNRQFNELEESLRSKQIQIEDLLPQVDEKSHEFERIKEESGDRVLADGRGRVPVHAGPPNGRLDAPG